MATEITNRPGLSSVQVPSKIRKVTTGEGKQASAPKNNESSGKAQNSKTRSLDNTLTDTIEESIQNLEKKAAKTAVQPEKETVEHSVQVLNAHIQNIKRELRFSTEEDTGQTVITVLDESSKEVIRQIPAEEVVEMAKVLQALVEENGDKQEALSGLILTVKV